MLRWDCCFRWCLYSMPCSSFTASVLAITLVNLEKLGFSQKLFFSLFKMEFRGFRGFQEERTDHTVLLAKFQPIWWYMISESSLFNILWQIGISMYQKRPSKPSILSRVSPGHLYYLFLDISPTYFSKIPPPKKNSIIEILKI